MEVCQMIIRPMLKEDTPYIKQILQDDLKAAGLNIPGTAYFDDNLDTLFEFYNASNQRGYYVVEQQGTVLGGAGFAEFDLDQGMAELQKLYLSEGARGQGLSYKLIDLIEYQAKVAGYKKLYLETHHNLKAAIHIYTKAGFKRLDGPTKTSHHSGAMDGFYIKDL